MAVQYFESIMDEVNPASTLFLQFVSYVIKRSFDNLDSMLVLKDILYHEWKDNI